MQETRYCDVCEGELGEGQATAESLVCADCARKYNLSGGRLPTPDPDDDDGENDPTPLEADLYKPDVGGEG